MLKLVTAMANRKNIYTFILSNHVTIPLHLICGLYKKRFEIPANQKHNWSFQIYSNSIQVAQKNIVL